MFALGDGLSSSEGSLETATDALLTIGYEGGVKDVQRTLSGGFGMYAGATGSDVQRLHGSNDTVITVMEMRPGISSEATNYRFTFSFTS